jgi:hypothetical protein
MDDVGAPAAPTPAAGAVVYAGRSTCPCSTVRELHPVTCIVCCATLAPPCATCNFFIICRRPACTLHGISIQTMKLSLALLAAGVGAVAGRLMGGGEKHPDAVGKPAWACPPGQQDCGTAGLCCPTEADADVALHTLDGIHCGELVATSNSSDCFANFWTNHGGQYSDWRACLWHAASVVVLVVEAVAVGREEG